MLNDPEVMLVASFTSLMAFVPSTGRWSLIHEGRGKYFGMVALDDSSVVVVSRTEGGLPDELLVLDRDSGELRRTIPLVSTDTHQIARTPDRLFVADTGHGRVLSMDVSDLAAPASTLVEFAIEDHINTVRPSGNHVDLLLHKFGSSELVRVEATTGEVIRRVVGVGENSHDLAPWRDRIFVCASALGGLISVEPLRGEIAEVWSRESTFTKGLVVVDGIAWFGCSAPSSRPERWSLACELVAVDVVTGTMVAHHDVPHGGLVNAIAQIGQLDAARLAVADA